DITATNVVWRVKIQVPSQSSPIPVGERIFMAGDSGMVSCLDAKTGKLIWKESIGGSHSASPIAAEGRIYFFDQGGAASVIEAADTFKVLAKNQLEDGFMASPAVTGKALILRTKKALYRIEK